MPNNFSKYRNTEDANRAIELHTFFFGITIGIIATLIMIVTITG